MTAKAGRYVRALASAWLLGLAASAWAQGMYYKEVEKDERIYVFNIGAEYERWEKSGELGRAITRLGYGPNGETVIFDSEQAIDLYNFKHGKAEVVERPPAPKQIVTWSPGRTTIETDRALLNISNRIQVRWTQEIPDETVQLPGTAASGDGKGSFRIRRAKFKLDGWFYKRELQYEFQANWPALTGSNVGAILEDANLNWDVSKTRTFQIKFGQYKVPFGHQQITSSGNQQFVDRTEVSDQYARGRDTGLQLWGQLFGNKVEWRAGVFNGNGLTRSTNDNDAYQYNARLVWQPNALIPLATGNSGALFSEGDFESTDKPIFYLAANFEKNDFHRTTMAVDIKDTVFGFDGAFKFKRFSATSEYYLRERRPETGTKFDSNGIFVQAGYLLNKGRNWEVAGRYGKFDPSDLVAGNDREEVGGALNWFYSNVRHNLKVQADFRRLEAGQGPGRSAVKNKELRIQTQFVF